MTEKVITTENVVTTEKVVTTEDLSMNVVYIDKHIAVVNKGFGEISEPAADSEQTADTGKNVYTPELLRMYIENMCSGDFTYSENLGHTGQPVSEKPIQIFPVHRLDRTTAGLMVYTLNKSAAAVLSEEIQSGELEKIYTAAVHGKPECAEGEMRDFLFFDRRKCKSFVSDKKRGGTKEAVLKYKLLETAENERWGEVSTVRVKLMTGRTHQIRVQFASRGMPLLGDGKYGSRANFKGCALVSSKLRLTHPVTAEKMEFTIPADMDF